MKGDNDDARAKHDAEQRLAAMREMAAYMATMYRNLIAENLPGTEKRGSGEVALYLTGQYIRAFFGKSSPEE